MRRSVFFALALGAIGGLGIQLAMAQPVDPGKFKNLTVTGTENVSVLDAGVVNVAGRLSVSGDIVGTATGGIGLTFRQSSGTNRITWGNSRYVVWSNASGRLSLTGGSDGINIGSVGFGGADALADSSTAPTISSGFGTSPSVVANNGTVSFTINVGTGGVATSGVIGLPTVASGWWCHCDDIASSAAHEGKQTVLTDFSTTSCTVENQTSSTGAAFAWTASRVLSCAARGR